MTARGYNNIPVFVFQQSFILPLYYGRSYCGFLRIVKAQLFKSGFQFLKAHPIIVGNKGGCNRGYYGCSRINKYLYSLGFVRNFLCVLGAYNEALTAEYTFVSDYVRLIARKFN